MSVNAEIQALAAKLKGASRMERARAAIRTRIYRRRVMAYRKCLLGEDGEFSAAAQILLADLARLAGIGKARVGRTPDEIQFDEGQRRIVLHLIESVRVDPARIARLAGRQGENDDE